MTEYADMSIAGMLARYNELGAELLEMGGTFNERKTFKDRSEAMKFLGSIESRLVAFKSGLAAEEARSKAGSTATKGEKKMSEKAPRTRASKEPKSELNPMRPGSIRARILEILDGKHTPAEIADRVGIEDHKVTAHLGALHKHTGVGYRYSDDGKVTAVYPKGKTYEDAVKSADEEEAA